VDEPTFTAGKGGVGGGERGGSVADDLAYVRGFSFDHGRLEKELSVLSRNNSMMGQEERDGEEGSAGERWDGEGGSGGGGGGGGGGGDGSDGGDVFPVMEGTDDVTGFTASCLSTSLKTSSDVFMGGLSLDMATVHAVAKADRAGDRARGEGGKGGGRKGRSPMSERAAVSPTDLYHGSTPGGKLEWETTRSEGEPTGEIEIIARADSEVNWF
jgi:hypothetical protein